MTRGGSVSGAFHHSVRTEHVPLEAAMPNDAASLVRGTSRTSDASRWWRTGFPRSAATTSSARAVEMSRSYRILVASCARDTPSTDARMRTAQNGVGAERVCKTQNGNAASAGTVSGGREWTRDAPPCTSSVTSSARRRCARRFSGAFCGT